MGWWGGGVAGGVRGSWGGTGWDKMGLSAEAAVWVRMSKRLGLYKRPKVPVAVGGTHECVALLVANAPCRHRFDRHH